MSTIKLIENSILKEPSRFKLITNTLLNKHCLSLSPEIYLLNKNLIVRSIFTSSILKNNKTDTESSQKSWSSSSLVKESENKHDKISTHVTGPRQRVKQAAKDVSYGFILLGGGVLLIGIFYILFSELFSRETPSGIYDESSKLCLKDYNVQDALGTPIKVSAESGGRRVFQIKHKYFIEDDGVLYLVINYYLEGPKNKGTVYCKVKKNQSTGKFEYEHILVKLDYLHRGEKSILVKHDN